MGEVISIVIAGIGGYGNSYVSALLDAPNRDEFRLVGAIDPNPSACRRLDELQAQGTPIYPSLESFYERGRADLAILSTPLHLHASQTCLALEHGSNVLCEKPLCVSPAQAAQMATARDRAGKLVAVGYQWSFSTAVQRLKADVLSGRLGRARRLRSLVLWPRDEAYYRRNRWAGAKNDPDGNLILDSPVNNACAHYLHLLLYVLGPAIDRSATPQRVTAELYRAHPIDNYDTAALRCQTTDGAEILFLVSHATASTRGPVFCLEFERGTVEFPGDDGTMIARLGDSVIRYGSPNEQRFAKLWDTLSAIRTGAPTVCGIEAASAHTRCAWAAQASGQDAIDFPADLVHVTGAPGAQRTAVQGLDEVLQRCYDQFALPSELHVSWARPRHASIVEPMIAAAAPLA